MRWARATSWGTDRARRRQRNHRGKTGGRIRIFASLGAIALTSRVSVEMVQKAVMAGCPILLAVSAPTARAVRIADEANLTVASLSRGEVQVFTHPRRIAARRRADRTR